MDILVEDMVGDYNFVVGVQIIEGELQDGVFGLELGNVGVVQEQKMYLLFVEDNWGILDNMMVMVGFCYDYYDVFGSQIFFCLYVVYNIFDYWIVKGGVSMGYKML